MSHAGERSQAKLNSSSTALGTGGRSSRGFGSSRSGGLGRSFGSGSSRTTARGSRSGFAASRSDFASATAAAVLAMVLTTVAAVLAEAAVATLAGVASATVRTTAGAAVTSRGAAAITTATTVVTEQTGRSRLLAADKRQADDREEQRDPKNQRAIHQNPPTGIPERTGSVIKTTVAVACSAPNRDGKSAGRHLRDFYPTAAPLPSRKHCEQSSFSRVS